MTDINKTLDERQQKRIKNIRTIYKKAEFFEKRSGAATPLSQRFFQKALPNPRTISENTGLNTR